MLHQVREMAGHIRKRFLLYPNIEIANFKGKDRDNSNAHSVLVHIMKGIVYAVPSLLYIFQCENIVSSFIFPWRLAMPDIDEQDKSHTFFL